jgi:hypothetical protein
VSVDDLELRRARRWWLTKPKVATIARAAAFIDDVGFALLWPTKKQALPSLWEAGSDRARGDAEFEFEYDDDAAEMWEWKDEIPRRKLAWYGYFVRGNKSFLSKRLLNDLYPRAGDVEDYKRAELSPLARKIANIVASSGPQSAAALREATDTRGSPFDRAVKELGTSLVITHFGVEEQGAGWPSAMYELTARAFKPKPTGDRVAAARTFATTMIACKPWPLARAFGWKTADARAALNECVKAGELKRDGDVFSVPPAPRRRA